MKKSQNVSTSPPSLAFIATPDFTGDILEHILIHRLAQVKVLWTGQTKPQGRGKKLVPSRLVHLAKKYGIPCYQPELLSTSENIALLSHLNVDLILVVAYGQIITKDFFSLPKWGTYNLHFSLLPKYRGASPIQSAILAGEKKTGITLQAINEKMDAGDVILQSSFDIRGLKASLVFEKSIQSSLIMISELLSDVSKYRKQKRAQAHPLATYCTKIKKQSGWIRNTDTVEVVAKKFLAFDPWPGIYFTFKEERFQILALEKKEPPTYKESLAHEDSSADKKFLEHSPGYVYSDEKKNLYLALKDGRLIIKHIKRQGKKALNASDFLNGCHLSFPLKID